MVQVLNTPWLRLCLPLSLIPTFSLPLPSLPSSLPSLWSLPLTPGIFPSSLTPNSTYSTLSPLSPLFHDPPDASYITPSHYCPVLLSSLPPSDSAYSTLSPYFLHDLYPPDSSNSTISPYLIFDPRNPAIPPSLPWFLCPLYLPLSQPMTPYPPDSYVLFSSPRHSLFHPLPLIPLHLYPRDF